MEISSFHAEIFQMFDRKWALLTTGTPEDFNTMAISWGGMGTLWGRPVVTVYIRPNRHTFGYMNASDFFTVSFYPEQFRKDLGVLGSLSGRDGDKVARTSLIPAEVPNGVSFRQAECTLVCRKMYAQDMDAATIPDEVMRECYAAEPVHRMYIGEVMEVLV